MRIVPYIALLKTRMIGPNPLQHRGRDLLPGHHEAAIAAKPDDQVVGMDKLGRGPSWRPGRRYCRKRFGQPLKFPASLVTIASSGRRSRNQDITLPRSSAAPAAAVGTSPASYSERTAARQSDQRGAGTGGRAAVAAANSGMPD